MNENERVAPVNVGEVFEVSIDAVGEKGDGIAKVKGFVLFVPRVKKGEYVKIKITKVLKNVGFAEVVEKLEHPPRPSSRFITVTPKELEKEMPKSEYSYEDTNDFGEDAEEE
ncbi:TRAM domain-containing protein [Candidatus Woesearchaeota archaeon]|nr:TRAM domain-containing protein [Candidatus Woesearchaeota archaeon]